MKHCSRCGITKPESEFYRRGYKGRYRSHCKTCMERTNSRSRAGNPTFEMRRGSYNTTTYKQNRKLILSSHPPCSLCGEPGADTADHIVPVSKGGVSDLANLRPAHRSCNSARGDKLRIRYVAKY